MLVFERLIAGRFYRSRKSEGFLSFITAFAIGGVAIGSAALIITLAIVNGFSDEIQKKLVAFGSHISVTAFSGEVFQYPNEKLQALDTTRFITSVSPVFARQGLVRCGKNLEGVLVNGVLNGPLVARLGPYMTDGRFFDDTDSVKHPVVLGRTMARLLGAELNSRITFFGISGMPSPGNLPNIIQGRVVGIFDTGMQGFDDLFVYVPLESARELFSSPGLLTEISLETDDLMLANDRTDELQNALPWPFFVRSIFQTQANLFGWIGLQQQMIPIIILALIMIAIINIVGTILMMVVDKTREVGILRSMGATGNQILRIFIGQGVLITTTGLIIGNVIGIGFCLLQYYFQIIPLPPESYFMDTVPIRLSLTDVVLVNVLTLSLSVLAAWAPAWVASRLPVSDTVRFG